MTYVNGVLKAIVGPAVAPVAIFTEQQMSGVAPAWVVVAQLPGSAPRVDPRFRGARVLVQIDAYATNSSRSAYSYCQAAVNALVAAHRAQTVTQDGRIATLNDVADPSPLPGPAQNVYRYTSTLQLTFR